jgi:hypothetical protein
LQIAKTNYIYSLGVGLDSITYYNISLNIKPILNKHEVRRLIKYLITTKNRNSTNLRGLLMCAVLLALIIKNSGLADLKKNFKSVLICV